ncbi:MAG: 50S ribosomal protein L21 [Alphaproteobacteria bacterium]|nr:50S ribosomal protein L21 [Alphaproteobacteria bacterium]MBU0798462.1 50S ribosomal protein L21 [Alphaproteobacteria bacterium]MBU0888420.1 50S ribosomal protein L21 [Alphaproteobacteria bacterium]MBU1814731.1 50S ribosomal protein L21 [Alphaproteobacteria bacterium]MBU2091629.1 50S ribosomal protein L21 [Alphaproteobacteria bacterium]
MFAVIKTGGKQYKVSKDDIILVEKLEGEAGSAVSLEEVLMVGGEGDLSVGAPRVAGASVAATIVEQTRGDKVIIFKKKRRKNHRRKNGHRQDLTVLRITDILAAGGKTKAKKAAPAAEAQTKE